MLEELKEAVSTLHTDTAPVGSSSNPSNKIFTLANCITICRLILTFIFLYLFTTTDQRLVCIIIYIIASTTDFLDGQVARRTQTVSWFGKLLDPIVDRALLFTGVLGLILLGELPVWIGLFVILRDVYLLLGSTWLHSYRSRPVDVAFIGKATTTFLLTGFSFMLIDWPTIPGLNLVPFSWLPGLNGQAAPLGLFIVYIGVILSTITACVYTHEAFKIKNKVVKERKSQLYHDR